MHGIRTFIFDLDGTLLHTLPDLVIVTNAALEACGFPPRSTEEILSFVGNGARALMLQAVPAGTPLNDTEKALEIWKNTHGKVAGKNTRPFPRIVDTCKQLKTQGSKLAVLSNKFDRGTQQIINDKIPGVFDAVHGESEAYPRKPDITGLTKTMNELGADIESSAYIGDSPGDIETALHKGILAVGVSWGYHHESELLEAGAHVILKKADDLLGLL